jgi:hypothetical protein
LSYQKEKFPVLNHHVGWTLLPYSEAGSFTEVPTESGIPTQVTRTLSFAHPDIVLGVEEVSLPGHKSVGAKISKLTNSKKNNFYAVQGSNSTDVNCTSRTDGFTLQLQNHHFDL